MVKGQIYISVKLNFKNAPVRVESCAGDLLTLLSYANKEASSSLEVMTLLSPRAAQLRRSQTSRADEEAGNLPTTAAQYKCRFQARVSLQKQQFRSARGS